MRIKFTAKTLTQYAGHDGNGSVINLKDGDIADVSDLVAKLLLQKYGNNFEMVVDEVPAHASNSDKLYRKSSKTKTK